MYIKIDTALKVINYIDVFTVLGSKVTQITNHCDEITF